MNTLYVMLAVLAVSNDLPPAKESPCCDLPPAKEALPKNAPKQAFDSKTLESQIESALASGSKSTEQLRQDTHLT